MCDGGGSKEAGLETRCGYCFQKLAKRFVCGKCKAIYCGAECQRKSWPAHKRVCVDPRKVKKEKDPLTGAWSNTRCPVCFEDLTLIDGGKWIYLPCCSSGICDGCTRRDSKEAGAMAHLRHCPYCRHDLTEVMGNIPKSLRLIRKNADRGCPMAQFKVLFFSTCANIVPLRWRT